MNILHISRTMGQGGAEKVVFQLCKDCKGPIYFVASCGGEYVNELEKIGTKHIQIPDIDGKQPDKILKTLLILSKEIKENKINIVHTHHRMAAFYARIIQIWNPRLKHIYTAHNVFSGRKKLMRFALSKASVIACGDTVKKNLVNEYGINSEAIEVIYNSIELKAIQDIHIDELDKKIEEGAYLIGSVGRITEQKGFDIFVKAIALCKKNNSSLVGVIIGDGEDREAIRQLVRDEGIEDSILFLGYQKDVLSLIYKMQFIVLASRWEGFPLIPIETFSVGKTIIVSNIDNNLEIVKPGQNGLAFQVNSVIDLAKKIDSLIHNPELKMNLESIAVQEYKKKYLYSVFLQQYANKYLEEC